MNREAFSGMQKAVANWAKEGKNSSEEFGKLMDSIKNSKSDVEATQKAIEAFGEKNYQSIKYYYDKNQFKNRRWY